MKHLASLLVPLSLTLPAVAQLPGPYIGAMQTPLVPGDLGLGDYIGYVMAVDGSSAAVGVAGASLPGASHCGAAYVFTRSGSSWSQQAKLTAADFDQQDNLGSSAAISGDTIAVGAPSAGLGPVVGGGAVYVFVRSGTTWSQQQKLVGTDTVIFDRFGSSVALEGDTLAIAANGADPNGLLQAGAVYIFTRSGTTWTQQAKVFASDPTPGDQFGDAIGLSGNTLAVGVRFDDAPLFNSGSAYVFTRSGSVWSQQQKLVAFDAASDDWFGSSIAVSGNSLVVGSARDDHSSVTDAGSAYVFARTGTTWSLQQKLTSPRVSTNEQFGHAVAIEGSIAIVGAASTEFPNSNAYSSAYAFTRSGTSWSHETTLFFDATELGDLFGATLALRGGTALVGATSFANSGAVVPFELTTSPAVYCTAKTNSLGCVPAIASTGTPSVSSLAAFTISATNVLNQRNGLLFYGYAPRNAPFQGGWLCIEPPTARTPVQNSVGNVGPSDCTGAYSYDFNARIRSGVDPLLVVGADVYAQFWSRDPASTTIKTGLTNALHFAIQP